MQPTTKPALRAFQHKHLVYAIAVVSVARAAIDPDEHPLAAAYRPLVVGYEDGTQETIGLNDRRIAFTPHPVAGDYLVQSDGVERFMRGHEFYNTYVSADLPTVRRLSRLIPVVHTPPRPAEDLLAGGKVNTAELARRWANLEACTYPPVAPIVVNPSPTDLAELKTILAHQNRMPRMPIVRMVDRPHPADLSVSDVFDLADDAERLLGISRELLFAGPVLIPDPELAPGFERITHVPALSLLEHRKDDWFEVRVHNNRVHGVVILKREWLMAHKPEVGGAIRMATDGQHEYLPPVITPEKVVTP